MICTKCILFNSGMREAERHEIKNKPSIQVEMLLSNYNTQCKSMNNMARKQMMTFASGLMVTSVLFQTDHAFAQNQSTIAEANSEQSASRSNEDQCLNAADYKGCMEFHSGTGNEKGTATGTVNVDTPSDYNYKERSIKQLKIRGSYGRYITFIGRTNNVYSGSSGYYNPGSPGRQVCNTYVNPHGDGGTTNCKTVGYVAPSYTPGTPGGTENRNFRYQLDCKDMTFDRKGDFSGFGNKGWMGVQDDPTAQAVANKYCPIIDSLPK